jgi:Ribbon-helix-helix protein, copG family
MSRRKVVVSFTALPETLERLDRCARASGVSRSEMRRRLIDFYAPPPGNSISWTIQPYRHTRMQEYGDDR